MFLLFDIGGTRMRLAVSKDGKEIGEPKIASTPQDDFEQGMRIFQETAKELLRGEKPESIIGGLAGTLNREHAVLLRAPHMRGWVEKPVKKVLEDLFSVPVVLENDAALAGLHEVKLPVAPDKAAASRDRASAELASLIEAVPEALRHGLAALPEAEALDVAAP